VQPATHAYCDAIFSDPAFRTWEAAAEAEPWSISVTDML
jgi:hypothetical protein